MKALVSFLLAVTLALPLAAQGPVSPSITVEAFGPAQAASADQITINGPATAKPGDIVTCTLAGTPSVDLSKPLISQLAWLMGDDRMFVYVQMPGQAMVPLDVEGTIVFSVLGTTMRPQVHFGVADPGEYRLVVDWNYGQNQLVEHICIVGGGPVPPDPPDPPDPPIPPVPVPAKLSVLLSYEAEDQPSAGPSQADLLTSPTLRAYLDTHCTVVDGQPAWRFLDLSTDDGSGLPVTWQGAVAAARGKPTPWIVIDNGKDNYTGPCPASTAELLAKLKIYGGD
jgi:hypothetical protein